MATNVEIIKNPNENPLSVLRRFTRRVQGSGVLPRVRSIRYNERDLSHYKVKKARLKTINRAAEIAELTKLGKMPEKEVRKNGRG